MAIKKKPAKASKQTSQPKAPAKKQPKNKVLPAPHMTHKQCIEEVSSDDESDEEPPQKPQKRMQKVVQGNDSDMNVNVTENGDASDDDDAHGGQQPQSKNKVCSFSFDC